MKITGNTLLAVLVGSVAGFLLGWAIYGILLDPFYQARCPHRHLIMRDMETVRVWGIFVAYVFNALFLTYVFSLAAVRGAGRGFTVGAILGALTTAAYDLMMFSTTNMYTKEVYLVDIPAGAIFTGIIGALIALVLGRGR